MIKSRGSRARPAAELSDRMEPNIRELTLAELRDVFPLVRQLRPHLSADEFVEMVTEMMSRGYRAICLCDGEKFLAYAGFAELLNLYYGKHIWIYELVVDENERGKGFGKTLLSHIESIARERDLNCVVLSSGVAKEAAHGFYEAAEYGKASFVFKKNLSYRG